MQASESKGPWIVFAGKRPTSISSDAGQLGKVCFFVFVFFFRIPRGVSPCALQKCVWIMGRRLGLSEEGD